MLKYEFSIQTRSGQKVENIAIAGHDQEHAQRKLFQMYRDCQVLNVVVRNPEEKTRHSTSMEDILTLISK